MIANIEKQLIELFNNHNSNSIRVSYILSQLDLSEFAIEETQIKFPVLSICKLYIFKTIKGIKTFEKLTNYLIEHENEAYELGFFKDESNKLQLPPKRTFNHILKTKLTPQQKQELNLIAQKILLISSQKNIVLDLEIVKKAIDNEVQKFTKTDLRDVTKLAKKLLYPNFDLNIKNNAKYTPNNILDVLTYMCFTHGFANDTSKSLNDSEEGIAPNGDTIMYHFHKLKSLTYLLDTFEKISDNLFNYVRKNYNILNNSRRFDIAYDIHDLDYWGKGANYVCGGEYTHGTSTFFKFLTCSIVVNGYRFIIDVTPIPPAYPLEKLLDESLKRVKNKIRIDMVFLDRGFDKPKIINVLKANKIKFVMPKIRSDRVKAWYDKSMACKSRVIEDFEYGQGKDKATVNLVIVDAENGDKHPFICNFPVAEPLAFHLYNWYSRRWGIETIFRLLDTDLRPRTTSNSYNIRLFYFLFSCCLYNLWVLINISVSLKLYGKVKPKPIISVKRFLSRLFSVDIDS
jgi:putative transposase